jgi:hypothetical protein
MEIAIAPVIGFDIPLSRSRQTHDIFSFGFNVKYIGISNSPDSYVSNAVVKYWY